MKSVVFVCFALGMAWLYLPSQADAQKFLSHCGGQRVRGVFMGAMCKRYPGKTIVRCNRRCTKRKFLKCVRWSWRRVAYKRCPQATPKRCGRKNIVLTIRNSGRRPIFFQGAIHKTRGSFFRPKANGISPGRTSGFKIGRTWYSGNYVMPGRTRTYRMQANIKTKCNLQRKLKILFTCTKKNNKNSAVKRVFVSGPRGRFRFYLNLSKRNCAGYIDATHYNFRQLVRAALPPSIPKGSW